MVRALRFEFGDEALIEFSNDEATLALCTDGTRPSGVSVDCEGIDAVCRKTEERADRDEVVGKQRRGSRGDRAESIS